MRRKLVYVGMLWAGLAWAAGGPSARECNKECKRLQKPCLTSCKAKLKKADHPHCAPACTQTVEDCKAQCGRPRP
ncbi:MAG: hypothetical protein FWC28_00360 [Proteobacteria bacterium]|nr:hypothetical protein [Pseudomonadota bacterium]